MKYFSGGVLPCGLSRQPNSRRCANWLLCVAVLASCAVATDSLADQLEMKNGDHYVGKVVSVTTNTVVFQSEVLGTVTLTREKVGAISLGAAAPTNIVASTPVPAKVDVSTNNAPDLSTALRRLGTNNTSMKQVEQELLSGNPEAQAKFNEMMKGLMTGKLTVNDIRAQARTAAEQLRDAKRELGDEAGTAVDGYLAILENFLKESGDTPSKATPLPTKTPTKPASPDE